MPKATKGAPRGRPVRKAAPAAVAEIEGYAALPADWDSYGARPISAVAIDAATALLRRAALELSALGESVEPFDVAPLANGGVQLEWRRADAVLEVEVDPAGGLRWLTVEGVAPRRRFIRSESATPAEVIDTLKELLQR